MGWLGPRFEGRGPGRWWGQWPRPPAGRVGSGSKSPTSTRLPAPPVPAQPGPTLRAVSPHLMSPVLWGQPSLHLSGVLCSKEPQRLLASMETSGGGKYLGKAFLKLGTHRKKNILDQISFAHGSCPGIQTAPQPQHRSCCAEYNGGTVEDIICAKGEKRTYEKSA